MLCYSSIIYEGMILMKTILKWPGGKEKELPVIRKYTPEYTGRYVEPFVGLPFYFKPILLHFLIYIS